MSWQKCLGLANAPYIENFKIKPLQGLTNLDLQKITSSSGTRIAYVYPVSQPNESLSQQYLSEVIDKNWRKND